MDSKTVSAALHRPNNFYCNNCLTNLPTFDDIETPSTTTSMGGTNKLYYTNCSHVVCQACRTSINNCCPFCKRKAQMMQISRRMPRHMQMYFEPMRKSIQNVFKVAKFQKEQQRAITTRLISNCHSIAMKVRKQKTENDKCKDRRERLMDGYRKLKQLFTKCSVERQRRIEQNRNRPVQEPYQERRNVYAQSPLQRRRSSDTHRRDVRQNVYAQSPPQRRRRSSTHRRDVYGNHQYQMSPLVEMDRSTRHSDFRYSTS